ncbi:MAG TPA: alkaline shock response membrane anchor protein AmaP, partial [Ignavibacteriales bacterium]|nr:alkaline shock response membrane anchor protein AmaP [Ignavibacteriales bacterium]
MRIFMRFLLTLYILLVLFVSVMVLGAAWGLIDISWPQFWISQLYNDSIVRLAVSIIVITVVLLSLLLMFYGIRKRKPKSALIKNTGLGAVFISISAIEEMTMRHIATNEAVRNVKATINIKDAKANILAKLAVAEGANI